MLAVCPYLVEELQVDVDATDDTGDTPLAYAVRGSSIDGVRYLLDHGANPDKLDNKGSTPLHVAAMQGECEIEKILLSSGAHVDSFSSYGTPLHLSAFCQQDGVMKILLDHHADFGHLPIELAAYNNRRKDVEILLPVTSRIPSVHDWSVDGVIRYVKSCPSVEDDPMYKMRPADMKLEASRGIQETRLHYCNEALYYANRFLAE